MPLGSLYQSCELRSYVWQLQSVLLRRVCMHATSELLPVIWKLTYQLGSNVSHADSLLIDAALICVQIWHTLSRDR